MARRIYAQIFLGAKRVVPNWLDSETKAEFEEAYRIAEEELFPNRPGEDTSRLAELRGRLRGIAEVAGEKSGEPGGRAETPAGQHQEHLQRALGGNAAQK